MKRFMLISTFIAFTIAANAQLAFFRQPPVISSGGSSYTGLTNTAPGMDIYLTVFQAGSNDTSPNWRVRRSTDNAEQDIPLNGTTNDAANLSAFCGAGDGFLVTWYDKSGNGRNVGQATAASQPKVYSSGAIITNSAGSMAVQFDGSGDFMTNGGWTIVTNIYTFTVTARPWGTASFRTLCSENETGSTGLAWFLSSTASGDWTANNLLLFGSGFNVGQNPRAIAAFSPAANSWQLLSGTISASAHTFSANGSTITTTGANAVILSMSGVFKLGLDTAGANPSYDGSVTEFAIYSNQTVSQSAVEANVNARIPLF